MSDSPLDWFAARFVAHTVTKTNFKIKKDLVSDHFFANLERILRANSNFTAINYLLELVSIFDRTIKRPRYLNSMPSVRRGSKEILNYLNNTNKIFRNLYQLTNLNSEDQGISNSFSNGDITLLQVLETNIVFWSTSDIYLIPHYVSLSELTEMVLTNRTLIRLTFRSKIAQESKTTEARGSFSYFFDTTSAEASLSLKQRINLPNEVITGQTILTTTALEIDVLEDNFGSSDDGSWKDSPDRPTCSTKKKISTEGDTSDTVKPYSCSPEITKTKTPISNIKTNAGTKKLQEERTRCISSLKRDSICRDGLRGDIFAEESQKSHKKYKESYTPITNSGNSHDETNFNIKPEKLKKSLQKVSNIYGRKKIPSCKKDIWEFSSSTPSSPKNSLPKNSPIRSLNDSQLVDFSNASSRRKCPQESRNHEGVDIINERTLIPKNCDMQQENQTLSGIPHKHVSASPCDDGELLDNNLGAGKDILEDLSSEEINSCFSNSQSQRQKYYSNKDCCSPRMEEIIKYKDGVVSTGSNSLDFRHQGNIPSSNSAVKSLDNTSILNSTDKTSFFKNGSSFATIGMNEHYRLLHESLNSFSSKLVQGVRMFEYDILKKEKEMQEQLDASFEQVAKHHLVNLKKLNDYAREKGQEILKELI